MRPFRFFFKLFFFKLAREEKKISQLDEFLENILELKLPPLTALTLLKISASEKLGYHAGLYPPGTEYDSVFAATTAPLRLHDGQDTLQLRQSASLTNTVVWNPGAALCARLPDMPRDGYAQMLCIEAAQIDQPVRLAPQTTWTGWQHLSVVR